MRNTEGVTHTTSRTALMDTYGALNPPHTQEYTFPAHMRHIQTVTKYVATKLVPNTEESIYTVYIT